MKTKIKGVMLYERVAIKGTAILYDTRFLDFYEIENISESGILVCNGKENSFPARHKVSLTLKSDRFSKPLAIQGIIVRKALKNGLGIEFSKMPESERTNLKNAIQEIKTEYFLNGKKAI